MPQLKEKNKLVLFSTVDTTFTQDVPISLYNLLTSIKTLDTDFILNNAITSKTYVKRDFFADIMLNFSLKENDATVSIANIKTVLLYDTNNYLVSSNPIIVEVGTYMGYTQVLFKNVFLRNDYTNPANQLNIIFACDISGGVGIINGTITGTIQIVKKADYQSY